MEEKRFNNVVNILFVLLDQGNSYFIGMEKDDGTINELCNQFSKAGHPKEKQISFFDQMIKQIAFGLYSIHANKIIHREIKPDNVVYKKNGDQYYFMLNNIKSFQKIQNVKKINVESPTFMAPELFQGDKYYHSSADIWAFGVMIYQLLSTKELFQGKSIDEIYHKIQKYKQENLDKNNLEYLKLPQSYQNLLKMMIVEDPKRRINIKQVLELLDKQRFQLAYYKYGNAQQFSDWDYFRKQVHSEVEKKLLDLQTKLRPLFVNQKDLIYKILIKIGEDFNILFQSQDQQNQLLDQNQIVIKYGRNEIQIILKRVSEYFEMVKEQYVDSCRLRDEL